METIPAPRLAALDTLFELAGCGDVWLYQRIMKEMGLVFCSRCKEFKVEDYCLSIYGRAANGTIVTYACDHCCEIIEQEGREEFEQARPDELIRVDEFSETFISKSGQMYAFEVVGSDHRMVPKVTVYFEPTYPFLVFGKDGIWHHNSHYEEIFQGSVLMTKSDVESLIKGLPHHTHFYESDIPTFESDGPDEDFTEEDLSICE